MDKYCNRCFKLLSPYRCAKCKETYYCSKECQLKDWKQHKLSCCQSKDNQKKILDVFEKYGIQLKKSENIRLKSIYDSTMSRCMLKYSEEKGRYFVAKSAIKRGEIIVSSSSYATIPNDSFLLTKCCVCLNTIENKQYTCNKCHLSYCSKECFDLYIQDHESLCQVFQDINDLSITENVNINTNGNMINSENTIFNKDILRLYCLILKQFQNEIDNSVSKVFNYVSLSLQDVLELSNHIYDIINNNKQLYETIRIEMLSIYSILNKFCVLPFSYMLILLLIIRYNSTPISYDETLFATGLFPAICYANHSCLPNSILFVDDTHQQASLRAIRPIKENEEICYSYIDLLSTYQNRQDALSQSFLFQCSCDRCSFYSQHMNDTLSVTQCPSTEMIDDRVLDTFKCNKLICNQNHDHNESCYCNTILNYSTINTYECPKCHLQFSVDSLQSNKKYIVEEIDKLNTYIYTNPKLLLSQIYKLYVSSEMNLLSETNILRFTLYHISTVIPMNLIENETEFFFQLSLIGKCITYYETVVKQGTPDLAFLYLRLSMQLYQSLFDTSENKPSIYDYWTSYNSEQGKKQCYESAKCASKIFYICYGPTCHLTVLATNLILSIEKQMKSK